MSKNPYQVITDQIISLLEQGTVPWQKPWNVKSEAKSLITKKPYRGINRLILNSMGYSCPYWATMKQINKKGGKVKKGEKSVPLVFWMLIEKTDSDTDEIKKFPLLRYYRVFNIEQTVGISLPEDESTKEHEFTPIEQCENIVSQMPNKPKIQTTAQNAWYNPNKDIINIPPSTQFKKPEEYYSTLFHELGHSTGHKTRLNRPTLTEMSPFGTQNYSKEELIAEMTAAMLCGDAGIANKTIQNSAAYINGWLQKLQNDSKFVIYAASQAQKAVDYIKNITFNN